MLNIPDQILLHLLAVTTIVSLAVVVNQKVNYILTTNYGMDQVVGQKIVFAMMLACHGSFEHSLLLQSETLKSEFVKIKHLVMKVY